MSEMKNDPVVGVTDEELILFLRKMVEHTATVGTGPAADAIKLAADRLEALTQPSGKVSDEQVEQFGLSLWGAHWQRGGFDKIRSALEAVQLPARPVVKALEWRIITPKPSDACVEDLYAQAKGDPLGFYYDIWRSKEGTFAPVWRGSPKFDYVSSFEEAKSAAQADYERRILSALEGEGE